MRNLILQGIYLFQASEGHVLSDHNTGPGRNNSWICHRYFSGASGVARERIVSLRRVCFTIPYPVVTMAWSGEHRGFVIETYLKNNDSVIATQRILRRHFRLGRNAKVPDRKTILLWVNNLRRTGSNLKTKPSGRPRSIRKPQNIEAVRHNPHNVRLTDKLLL